MAIELNNRHNRQDDVEANIDAISHSGMQRPAVSDDDDGSSDTSSILTELGADEFPGHFREHRGRLFHSHGNLPYPLPVDGDEQAVRSYPCLFLSCLTRFLSVSTRSTRSFVISWVPTLLVP